MDPLDEILRQLRANAQAIQALVESVSDEQAGWKPDAETWSLKETMEHVFFEEMHDFRKHLKELLSRPPRPWEGPRPSDEVRVERCGQALAGFLAERQASLAWLEGLRGVDWTVSQRVRFGEGEIIELNAGDVLVSWAAHDYLHIRQINELLYAWNDRQAAPHSVMYAGGW